APAHTRSNRNSQPFVFIARHSGGMVSDFVLGSYVPSSKPKTKSDTWHSGHLALRTPGTPTVSLLFDDESLSWPGPTGTARGSVEVAVGYVARLRPLLQSALSLRGPPLAGSFQESGHPMRGISPELRSLHRAQPPGGWVGDGTVAVCLVELPGVRLRGRRPLAGGKLVLPGMGRRRRQPPTALA